MTSAGGSLDENSLYNINVTDNEKYQPSSVQICIAFSPRMFTHFYRNIYKAMQIRVGEI